MQIVASYQKIKYFIIYIMEHKVNIVLHNKIFLTKLIKKIDNNELFYPDTYIR